jgi:hypothetical protein
VTPEDFAETLKDVQPGQGARVPYETFDLIFPPGHSDDNARAAAYQFAKQRGFKIDNRPDDGAVWFYRDA